MTELDDGSVVGVEGGLVVVRGAGGERVFVPSASRTAVDSEGLLGQRSRVELEDVGYEEAVPRNVRLAVNRASRRMERDEVVSKVEGVGRSVELVHSGIGVFSEISEGANRAVGDVLDCVGSADKYRIRPLWLEETIQVLYAPLSSVMWGPSQYGYAQTLKAISSDPEVGFLYRDRGMWTVSDLVEQKMEGKWWRDEGSVKDVAE